MEKFSAVVTLEAIKGILTDVEKEATRFDRGIKTSGTKVRKAMQELKALAQQMRDGIAETRETFEPDPTKSARAKERSVFCKK